MCVCVCHVWGVRLAGVSPVVALSESSEGEQREKGGRTAFSPLPVPHGGADASHPRMKARGECEEVGRRSGQGKKAHMGRWEGREVLPFSVCVSACVCVQRWGSGC